MIVDLISRLPPVMQKYKELQQLYAAENPEFETLWRLEALMRRNLFIITAEEEGLRRYERLLGTTPLPDESFESRRNHILMLWNGMAPYTYRSLRQFLATVTERFSIRRELEEDTIHIQVVLTSLSQHIELARLLRVMLPAGTIIRLQTGVLQPHTPAKTYAVATMRRTNRHRHVPVRG